VYNLSQMAPFAQSKDRQTRKEASLAVSAFFEEHEATLDRIYDELVQLRTTIAKKLGYENFIQLGYDRMGRTDYGAAEVKTYRDQIYQDIVPLVTQLTARKAKRLGIDHPYSFILNRKPNAKRGCGLASGAGEKNVSRNEPRNRGVY